MSKKHPIIAVTGSSGAGTSTVKEAFEHIFRRNDLEVAVIEGDSYHRYNRKEMHEQVRKSEKGGDPNFSHFGLGANLIDELGETFSTYAESGTGKQRWYVHSQEEAEGFSKQGMDVKPGEFTPWQPLPEKTDLMFYEGLHGCVVTDKVDMTKAVDLKVGVTPVINLEWIQKIHRDTKMRGYTEEAVLSTILRRMHDYTHYIIPQFKETDINFQRVPVVDTSDPIIARDIPTPDESLIVIRFHKIERFKPDFPFLLQMLHDSFMSRRNTIVVPGGKMRLAMELIFQPIIETMVEESRHLR